VVGEAEAAVVDREQEAAIPSHWAIAVVQAWARITEAATGTWTASVRR